MAEFSLAGKRALIVEDEPAIGEICHRVLTADGLEVDIAGSGMAAQEMARSVPYDVCLLDIRMPDMDGRDFFHWLEEKKPDLAEHVVFTTGDVVGRDTQGFLEQTGRPFLPKPFTPEELRTVVRETLEGT